MSKVDQLFDVVNDESVSDLTPKVQTKSIMTYLSNLLREKVAFQRAKMIVLGDDGCGKTSLIRALTGQPDYKEPDSSMAIGIAKWTLRTCNEVQRMV